MWCNMFESVNVRLSTTKEQLLNSESGPSSLSLGKVYMHQEKSMIVSVLTIMAIFPQQHKTNKGQEPILGGWGEY